MNIIKKLEAIVVDLVWNHPFKITFTLGFITGFIVKLIL